MSIANQVLDFYDDIERDTWSRIKPTTTPELVKKATVSEQSELLRAGAEAYALSTKLEDGTDLHKYPVLTPADTWISAAYFAETSHKLPEGLRKVAAANIQKALEKHRLPLLKKEAKQNSDYFALKSKYPIDTASQVKLASSYFEEWHRSFKLSDRREYATKVASRAKDLGVETLSPAIRKYAGQEYGTEIPTQLRLRRDLVSGTESMCDSLNKVAEAQKRVSPDKFAELLGAWDREAGVDRYHGKYLADPYEATYSENPLRKIAGGYSWEDESTGLKVSEADLKKVAEEKSEKIRGFLGESVAKELQKHGSQIFDSLPTDAKIVVAKIARGLI
jgi:hypothetical protein